LRSLCIDGQKGSRHGKDQKHNAQHVLDRNKVAQDSRTQDNRTQDNFTQDFGAQTRPQRLALVKPRDRNE